MTNEPAPQGAGFFLATRGAGTFVTWVERAQKGQAPRSRWDRYLGMTAPMTQVPHGYSDGIELGTGTFVDVILICNTKGTVPIVRLKAREKNRLKFCRI